MALPIMMDQNAVDRLVAEFAEAIKKTKILDGKISFSKSLAYRRKTEEKIKVIFSELAYIKMRTLLNTFSSEVAWHATADRLGETSFRITDIFVYPQEVTGTTVNTDQEAYAQWLIDLDADTANKLHCQMHSHVDMGTSPSAVDLTHQNEIVQTMREGQFYIFMIWNKRMEHNIRIFDMTCNTMYEDSDIEVTVEDEGIGLEKFKADAEKMVKKKTFQQTTMPLTSYYGGGYYGSAGQAAVSVGVADTGKDKKSKREGKKSGTKTRMDGTPVPTGSYKGGYDYAKRFASAGARTDYDAMIFGNRGMEDW